MSDDHHGGMRSWERLGMGPQARDANPTGAVPSGLFIAKETGLHINVMVWARAHNTVHMRRAGPMRGVRLGAPIPNRLYDPSLDI